MKEERRRRWPFMLLLLIVGMGVAFILGVSEFLLADNRFESTINGTRLFMNDTSGLEINGNVNITGDAKFNGSTICTADNGLCTGGGGDGNNYPTNLTITNDSGKHTARIGRYNMSDLVVTFDDQTGAASNDGNNYTINCSVTGTTTKTATCSRNNWTNFTFTWTDLDTDTDTNNVYGNGSGLNLTTNNFSIRLDYPGQTSITTLGTIVTGTWQGTTISVTYLDLAGIVGNIQNWSNDRKNYVNYTSLAGSVPNVTLAGHNYLSISAQQITAGSVNLANHVTGTLNGSSLNYNGSHFVDNGTTLSQNLTFLNANYEEDTRINDLNSSLTANASNQETKISTVNGSTTNLINRFNALNFSIGNSSAALVFDADGGTFRLIAGTNTSIPCVNDTSNNVNCTINAIDTNTQYTNSTGINLTGTTFSINLNYFSSWDQDSSNDITTSTVFGNATGSEANVTGTYNSLVINITESKLDCVAITGSAGLCDGNDAAGAGSYDLNFSNGTSTGVVTDTDIFNLLPGANIGVNCTGTSCTISSTASGSFTNGTDITVGKLNVTILNAGSVNFTTKQVPEDTNLYYTAARDSSYNATYASQLADMNNTVAAGMQNTTILRNGTEVTFRGVNASNVNATRIYVNGTNVTPLATFVTSSNQTNIFLDNPVVELGNVNVSLNQSLSNNNYARLDWFTYNISGVKQIMASIVSIFINHSNASTSYQGALSFYVNKGGTMTEAMRIDNSTNVHIGAVLNASTVNAGSTNLTTTQLAEGTNQYFTPQRAGDALQNHSILRNNTRFVNSTESRFNVTGNFSALVVTVGANALTGTDIDESTLSGTASSLVCGYAAATNAGWLNGSRDVILANNATNVSIDARVLFVDTANNFVGIGTDAPNRTLHVNGSMQVGNDQSINITGVDGVLRINATINTTGSVVNGLGGSTGDVLCRKADKSIGVCTVAISGVGCTCV